MRFNYFEINICSTPDFRCPDFSDYKKINHISPDLRFPENIILNHP